MYVVCVSIWVNEGQEEAFIEAVHANAVETRKEQGNHRFDVLRGAEDTSSFFLYEVYESEEDFRTHQQTGHYLAWREAVKDMMAKPREGRKFHCCFPEISRFDAQ